MLKVLSCLAYLVGIWAVCYHAPWSTVPQNKYAVSESVSVPLWSGKYADRKDAYIRAGSVLTKNEFGELVVGSTPSDPEIELKTSLLLVRLGILSVAFGVVLMLLHYSASCLNHSNAPATTRSVQ